MEHLMKNLLKYAKYTDKCILDHFVLVPNKEESVPYRFAVAYLDDERRRRQLNAALQPIREGIAEVGLAPVEGPRRMDPYLEDEANVQQNALPGEQDLFEEEVEMEMMYHEMLARHPARRLLEEILRQPDPVPVSRRTSPRRIP